MRILVFGDSYVYGAWDTVGGWVERLKAAMHKRTVETEGEFKCQVLNLGIGSQSSTEILARLENEIIARYSKNWPCMLIFSYGTNDERMIDGEVQTSIEQFMKNTEEIVRIARKYTDKILFVGMPPLSLLEVAFKRHVYSDQRMHEYDQILQKQVEGLGIRFVPLRDEFDKRSHTENIYYTDRLHPNDNGHKLIYEIVNPEIDKLLEQ